MEENKYDFNAPIEITSTGLAKLILERFNDSKEDLIYRLDTQTPEEKKVAEEKATDFAIGIMQAIAATDLPADYAALPIEKLIAILSVLKNYINGSARQAEDEFLSRTYGVKHPVTGKYRKDLITLGALMMKVDEARKATGDNPDDFFNPPQA